MSKKTKKPTKKANSTKSKKSSSQKSDSTKFGQVKRLAFKKAHREGLEHFDVTAIIS